MNFTVKINCDNEAFGDDPLVETARILRAIADKLDGCIDGGPVRDVNGNTVGDFHFSNRRKS